MENQLKKVKRQSDSFHNGMVNEVPYSPSKKSHVNNCVGVRFIFFSRNFS